MQDTSYDLYLVVRNGVTTMPATITTLSNKAKQPKGGYLPVKLHPALAPYKVAVLPLSKKLSDQGDEVFAKLAKHFSVTYDDAQSIGKRYRRQDAIGTPFCVTVDFETANDGCVTVRDRDTMQQERIALDDLVSYIEKRIEF